LPRGKSRVIGALALRVRLAGTDGLEARAARVAVACPGRAEAPARRLRRQRGGPGSVRLAGGRGYGAGGKRLGGLVTLGFLGGGALLMGIRRRSGAQEPSGGGRDAGPGIVVEGWLVGCRLGVGLGRLGSRPGRLRVRFRVARARNDQAQRNRPGGHEVFRIIPAEQAGTLPFFLSQVLRRGPDITVPTRLVTFCTHNRPQSRHTFLADTAVCRSSDFLVQRDSPWLDVTD